jgi:hypothetical protein
VTANDFAVSVVIPVYKAERFIRRAVDRVLLQPEVREIVLVEDGSPDDSLRICQELAATHDLVHLYQHEHGVNRGAAATRNAGIAHSTKEFVAFADADNLYLPNRFTLDREIFAADPSIDGVYHAQGVHYEDDKAREAFFRAGLGDAEFLSISEPVPPEELLSALLGRHPTAKMLGGLGIDAITLRRRCFDKAGLFPTELRLQQDVLFFLKLAAACRMQAGQLSEPVALRGVHGDMRSTDSQLMDQCRTLRWQLFDRWMKQNITDAKLRKVFSLAFADYKIQNYSKFAASWELLKSFCAEPSSLMDEYGRFDLNYLAIGGNNKVAVKVLSAKNRMLRAIRG